jgi:hypothetical protein
MADDLEKKADQQGGASLEGARDFAALHGRKIRPVVSLETPELQMQVLRIENTED